nr:MAG TPA: hypothetical protein [Caudoviricetes sp.]
MLISRYFSIKVRQKVCQSFISYQRIVSEPL